MKPIELPSLGHFLNKNGWLGSAGEMRFQIERPAPPEEGDGPLVATVVLWQGPWSRPYAQEVDRERFPVTEEGRTAMLAWLDQKAAWFEAQPPFSAQELSDFYWAKKREETGGTA